ncbi:MAG: hypothetical protein HY826_15215 [Actinobacteria bacterium]|nr:hypothetical protein [Actinomycetota bacterium]
MVAPGDSAAVASRVLGRVLTSERAITVDQSNYSVVVDEEVVVKWLQPSVPAPHPGVELLQHLARRGFVEMPSYLGCEVADEFVVALVTEFVPGARDGWDWFVDEIDDWLRGESSLDGLIGWAARMGELTGRLHDALHDMQSSTVAARTYYALALDRLDDALRAPATAAAEVARLRALVPKVHAALSPLNSAALLPAHRIHADLHAGQFLRAADRLLLTDFDGNPLATGEARRLPQSPLVDVASMLQAIDHVGRIAIKRRHPDRVADVERFIGVATDAALDAYRGSRTIAVELLSALRVAQELHEYCYATRYLPRWLYVPDAALPALLRH